MSYKDLCKTPRMWSFQWFHMCVHKHYLILVQKVVKDISIFKYFSMYLFIDLGIFVKYLEWIYTHCQIDLGRSTLTWFFLLP